MVAMTDIQAVVDRIAEAYDPECVVLFGSYARGTATSDSDVDLLVILPFEGKSFWKSLEITNRVNPPFAVDVLAGAGRHATAVRPGRPADSRGTGPGTGTL